MFDAIDVANYIICYLQKRDKFVTSLKLQKILYYVAADFFKKNDRLLFDDKIEKWYFGPVVPTVYHTFKIYGYSSIDKPSAEYPENLNDYMNNDELIDHLAAISARKLVEYTHEEQSWKKYQKLIEHRSRGLIYSDDELKEANLSFLQNS